MAKQKRQINSSGGFWGKFLWGGRSTDELEAMFDRADRLINLGRANEAVELLSPFLAKHKNHARLHYYIGYAKVKAGNIFDGLSGYERALDLSGEPSYWEVLAGLYLQVGMNVHALQAFRNVIKYKLDIPEIDKIPQLIASLEADVAIVAADLGLSTKKMEDGLLHLENGIRLLNTNQYQECVEANRKAIKILKNWPPPYNNLSLALFFEGQVEEAMSVIRQLLADYPNNVQSLSNAIRFLACTGRREEAEVLWLQLKHVEPEDEVELVKKAEAAAFLDQDEMVYQLLKSLDMSQLASEQLLASQVQIQHHLAVAEANTNRIAEAKKRMKHIKKEIPFIKDKLSALQEGKRGVGYLDRFPYYHSSEILPRAVMEEFFGMEPYLDDELAEERFFKKLRTLATRYPQIVTIAEKMIWEEGAEDTGLMILVHIQTPAGYEALRRIAFGQTGPDQFRMNAVMELQKAGEISQGEKLTVWLEGEWREIESRAIELGGEPDMGHSPEVLDLLEQSIEATHNNDLPKAEKLLKQIINLEPEAKDAYNNLGAIYAKQNKPEQARKMFETAIELDYTYAFPRANLVQFYLNEDDVAGAEAILEPLKDETQFHPEEMVSYQYALARVMAAKKDYEQTERCLKFVLQLNPEHKGAADLLDRLGMMSELEINWGNIRARQQAGNQARRLKLQATLTTAEPVLKKALSLYAKDVLTGMGRVIIPGGGWSTCRKAELVDLLVESLTDLENLQDIVEHLADEDQQALKSVLERGGSMLWTDFDHAYGNDLEESPYWQYHTPKTPMGYLRLHGLLVEATVKGEVIITVPKELSKPLTDILGKIK